MTSSVLVMAGPIELFPDNRQLTLWSSCSTTIALSRPPSAGRFSNGNSNLENTLVVDVDDQSTVGREEGTAQQMAHTSSLRLVYRELTERVIIFTAGSMHEQFHCAERLFQQLYIGKEARVFHDTSSQRIMKCDADVHEEMCTCVVLSGDTTMFQDIDEHMPTTSAPISMQIKVICPPEQNHSVAQACAEAPHGHSSGYCFPDASGRCNKSDVRVRRAGRTSEGLASYQGHFPVDDRAFEYLPSAKVR